MTEAGCIFIFWVADRFALTNNKMDGDLEIKTVGKYMIEIWKVAGMDMTNVLFKWASDTIISDANECWSLVLDIVRNSVTRITRCA